MAADQILSRPVHPRSSTGSGVDHSTRRAAVAASDRLVRQIQRTDAWIADRRDREQVLGRAELSRDQRLDAARETETLRRTHDAIKGRCARGLSCEVEPMRPPGLTAVIAHRHAWLVERLVLFLGAYGVTVLECTDNGAEALGVVVAEQPDVLVAGDCLAMMPGHALLTRARRYAPRTLLAGQASYEEQARYETVADTVFLRHHAPDDIADTLVAMLILAAAERECG